MKDCLRHRRLRFGLSVVGIFLTLTSVRGVAQDPGTGPAVAKAIATLPGSSQTVIARLAALNSLPEGTWRMHAGDLAHGEAVGLDDSAWKTIAVKDKASEEAVWFRQTITVPPTLNGYDLTGARIWFQFHAFWHGSMPEILYFNGRRAAMGDDLEPVVLLEDAKPGDKVVIAVKLLHTLDTKRFDGATLRVEFPANRPNPEDLRKEFVSAALMVPSLAPGDASRMATLNGAIDVVNLKALDSSDQKAFDASLLASQQKLEALRPLLQTMTFHMTGNSHIDAAWLWPWTETVDVVKRTFGTALQLMYEYPRYTYTQSAAAYNDWLAEKYPDMNAEIKQRIQEGRWEIVGGMWVEPDLNMPDGESLVRQLLVGKRWYKQAYGVDVRVGWNPDSFGYNWQLPQIYKKSGVDYFVTQKMVWNDTNQLPFKLFWWESPDGSKVLAYFPHGYDNDKMDPVRLSADLADARKKSPGMPEIMDLYGVGDHGGGPTRAVLDEGFHWAPDSNSVDKNSTATVTPKMAFGTALPFFTAVEKQIAPDSPTWDYASIAKGYTPPAAVAGKIAIPTWKSEMYFEYHRGIYTTQAQHKRNMREGEEEVLNAEKWSSLAWLDGKAYPGAELTEDWKKVLFNQFHDLAAGSGIGVIYKDAQRDYDVVRWSTNEISAGALQAVVERVNTESKNQSGIPVVVYNPLGWERSGDVKVKVQLPKAGPIGIRVTDVARNVIVGFDPISMDKQTGLSEIRVHAENIPALGYKVFEISPETAFDSISAPPVQVKEDDDTITLESNFVRVVVNKHDGCLSSLYDKKAKFETLTKGACGNELQAFKDTPKDYDAWNIDPGTLDRSPTLLHDVASVEVVGKESTSPAIRISSAWQNSKFVQTLSFESLNSNEVNVDTDIDWHEKHVLLKAAFPLAVQSDHATYEIPYGSIERTTKRTNSWEKAQFEVPALRWADLGDGQHGLSVINESKYGYDAAGNVLRLTLLRSPTWPDPVADQGHQHFKYAIYPHAGTWQHAMTVRHGWEYNYPLTAVVTTAHAGTLPTSHSFASVAPENVTLTAVKKAEDSNALIFRMYEWAGKASTVEVHVPAGATGATVVNMMEQAEGDALPVSGDVVKASIKPYEILTLRVDYTAK